MSEEMRDATDEAQKYLEMVRTRGEAHANPYRVYEEIASNMTDGNLLKPDWRALFRETGTQGSGGDVWKSAMLLVTRWASTLLWGRAAILALFFRSRVLLLHAWLPAVKASPKTLIWGVNAGKTLTQAYS